MVDNNLRAAMDEFQRCCEQRDVTGAAALLHDEYALVLVHPAEVVMPRSRWLEVLPAYVVHEYETETEVTDVSGSCASSVQRASMRATVLGEDRSGTFVISDTWLRTSTGWRLWRRHSTPLAARRMPGVT
jgi:hypothetical protein